MSVPPTLMPGCASIMNSTLTTPSSSAHSEAFADLPEGVDLELGELKELADKHRGEGGGETRQQEVGIRARLLEQMQFSRSSSAHIKKKATVKEALPILQASHPIVAIIPIPAMRNTLTSVSCPLRRMVAFQGRPSGSSPTRMGHRLFFEQRGPRPKSLQSCVHACPSLSCARTHNHAFIRVPARPLP